MATTKRAVKAVAKKIERGRWLRLPSAGARCRGRSRSTGAAAEIIEEASFRGEHTEPSDSVAGVRGARGVVRRAVLLLQPWTADSSEAR